MRLLAAVVNAFDDVAGQLLSVGDVGLQLGLGRLEKFV